MSSSVRLRLHHGVDLVAISRFREVVSAHEAFEARVFTERERSYCRRQADPPIHFAVRFAAKEATLKALGLGITPVGIDRALGDIEVVREQGAPEIVLRGRPAEVAERLAVRNTALSLSHTDEHALASVVMVSETTNTSSRGDGPERGAP